MGETGEKTCFVVMGFGTKTDFQTGRSLDLDKAYRGVIKPAVQDAGLRCLRADEIVSAGSIDVTMFQQLLDADVVVADISTCNPNALYELGVRHALRPYTTVIISEDKLVYPFDVSHIVIRKYQHLGTAIDVEEANRFRKELADAVRELVAAPTPDSPVYTYLNALRPPVLKLLADAADAVAAATAPAVPPPPAAPAPAPAAAAAPPAPAPAAVADETLSGLSMRAELALDEDRFTDAVSLFEQARALRPGDAYLTQQLALATYKTAQPSPLEALQRAREILMQLDPAVSNDPATLGLWGSVHKHLWDITAERPYLDEAIRAHERGFDIRNDSYNGINLAFLFNVRAKVSSPAEQIADFVSAERVRRRVIVVCEDLLAAGLSDAEARYWTKATLAEAYLGIGDEAASAEWRRRANEEAVAVWMRDSAARQLAELAGLLVPSPLGLIAAANP